MSGVAIRAEGIGKQYRRGLHLEPYRTARDALVRAARGALRRERPNDDHTPWFWALQDVSFELKEGQTLGIVGRNGAGKTTLLKVLSRVTPPTRGRAELRGRVGTLLEVGTGFHLELTGRENIKLNGAILGMSRREIAARLDEIVDFAGVEDFVDTPVKRYSTGMFMRLAFSVAAHLEPDILIVDEVLAVGDAEFQKKCLGKLDEVGRQGRTVLFVSHNIAAVEQICTHGLLLERGQVIEQGPIATVVERYLGDYASAEAEVVFDADPERATLVTRLATLRADGAPSSRFGTEEPIVLEAEFATSQPLAGEHLWVRLYEAGGLLLAFAADDDVSPAPDERAPGRYRGRFTIPSRLLNEGNYQFRVQLLRRRGVRDWHIHDDRRSGYFTVEDTIDPGDRSLGARKGILRVPIAYEEERIG